ncbi:MAG: desulfoferrodoxin [Prevotella sp.]|nr:desulfoferrodoxin [Prevotella sp.]MEE1316461.1 desulfoferrodoxin [Prevotella sp.]
MTQKRQIYRCAICGNIVEITNEGAGTLVCCGKPMNHLEGNTTDAAVEKHVPVLERTDGGYIVKVGSAEHPMTEQHYIQWIELLTETMVLRKELTAADKPEAFFMTDEKVIGVREYCNLHGLWKIEENTL